MRRDEITRPWTLKSYCHEPGCRGRRRCNACRRIYMREYRGSGREKVSEREGIKRATRLLSHKMLRQGLLVRTPCEECGAEAEMHHPELGNAALVRWLCREHHLALHGDAIRQGGRKAGPGAAIPVHETPEPSTAPLVDPGSLAARQATIRALLGGGRPAEVVQESPVIPESQAYGCVNGCAGEARQVRRMGKLEWLCRECSPDR